MKFEKISIEQWEKDLKKYTSYEKDEDVKSTYENIKIPTRGSEYSAGYDFYIPYDFTLSSSKRDVILTGIRWNCENENALPNFESINYVLLLFARSSVAKECGFSLINKVGVIDYDYYMAVNEGHIMIIVDRKTAKTDYAFKTGDRIVQGVITQFHTVENDIVLNTKRTGGFGSSGK